MPKKYVKLFSKVDKLHLRKLRNNVNNILKYIARKNPKKNILDIGPQDYFSNKKLFKNSNYKSMDINETSIADFKLDICANNKKIIADKSFDLIICTEVLEHTSNPFLAVKEIYRLLKKGRQLHLTTPLNLRIHGPKPDNWRFTDQGLRVLLQDFKVQKIKILQSSRYKFPIQHYVISIKI